MKTFKDSNNNIHEIDEAHVNLLPADCVEITKEEADELRKPTPETPEQLIARLESALDSHLDSVAVSYRYESIRTMTDYRDDPNPKFKAEGKAAYLWRSAVYTKGISLIEEVQSGQREVPTEAELIALMPLITDYLTYD
jgi:hypothetical protein